MTGTYKEEWNDEEHLNFERRERAHDVEKRLAQRRSMRTLLFIGLAFFAVLCIMVVFSSQRDLELRKQYLYPGSVSYQRGDCGTAEKDLGSYLRLSGKNYGYIDYDLGVCCYREGRSSDALGYFLQDAYYVRGGRGASATIQEPGPHIRPRSEMMIERIAGHPILP